MILVIVEHRDGKIKKSTFEAISEGKRIADAISSKVSVLLLGHNIDSLTSELLSYGAEKIFTVDNSALSVYSAEIYTNVITNVCNDKSVQLVLLPATSMGKDLAPRIAVRSNAGLISDCTKIENLNGKLIFTRPMYAGKVISKVSLSSFPGVVTLRPNVFEVTSSNHQKSEVEKITFNFTNVSPKAKVLDVIAAKDTKIELTEADIIVSGGRGVKSPENFKLIEELANVIKAAVGASRAVVDAGWKTHEYQVGQTGKTVTPNLYIACGISGAIQHLAGMASSKYIVAINKDSDAPIFKISDFGIVGDLFEVLPLLTEEIRKIKSS